MTNLHSNQQNKGFAARTPWNDENDENGGCPVGKGMVYQKHRFLDPEKYRKTCMFDLLRESATGALVIVL